LGSGRTGEFCEGLADERERTAAEIEALPKEQQVWLWEKLSQLTEADIPESLRHSMAEAERGERIDLDDALRELDAP
jgi:hypothetical protein